MLTVLIPTFHYNAVHLVKAIQEQCLRAGIIFEIICQDDASKSELNTKNEKINSLANCHFYTNIKNLGRGRNINSLVLKAKYDYVLLLDCDTLPTKDTFIQKYLDEIKKEKAVVFGGIVYHSEKPKQKNSLRWVYGQKREALSVALRKENPYFSTLTSNILFKKKVFLSNPFNENIKNYGYEDVVWVKKLKEKSIIITHIENPTFHLNLETSEIFIEKIHQSLKNLLLISNLGLITATDNRILRTYVRISNIGLAAFFSFIFATFHKKIKANLVSNHPYLFLLDVYKLCYYCKINSK
ncbi:glycosyltransferase [Flavobacterium sp.]|uniref:glycosyltransferase family 2 protein n=1 Tax=Flavobacterium sp. TaxID=239 RepID=UPI0025F68B03|nr:glycosyltransferase [Flavobacterium sp.]